MESDRSALWQACDRLLRIRADVGLEQWLRDTVEARQQAHPRGWADFRGVADELAQRTGIRVSHEAIRQWWQHIERTGAA